MQVLMTAHLFRHPLKYSLIEHPLCVDCGQRNNIMVLYDDGLFIIIPIGRRSWTLVVRFSIQKQKTFPTQRLFGLSSPPADFKTLGHVKPCYTVYADPATCERE